MRKTSHTHKQDNVTNKPPKQTNKKGKKEQFGDVTLNLKALSNCSVQSGDILLFVYLSSSACDTRRFLIEKKKSLHTSPKKISFLALLTLAVQGGAQLAPNSTFMVDGGDGRQREFRMANP